MQTDFPFSKVCTSFLQSEGEYEGAIAIYNPLDGWMVSETFEVQVLETIGPIEISDGSAITEKNETRPFTIKFGHAGGLACVVFDAGDESELTFFGNPKTCSKRFPSAVNVTDFNIETKIIHHDHLYE